MALLAATGFSGLLALLFVLACPLMMISMMRGMHAGRAGGRHGGASDERPDHSQKTLGHLEHEHDLVNDEIAQRAEQTVHAND